MSKFKKGDRVKIINYESYNGPTMSPIYLEAFEKYVGKEAVITNIDGDICTIDIDNGKNYWHEDMFEETGSKKNDRIDNKVMMELLPWPELEEIAKVYTAGAKKYGAHNWENLPDGYERYKGAMLRHLTEVEKGNDVDDDTGCLHSAQVAWNAIAMLHFKMKELENVKLNLKN